MKHFTGYDVLIICLLWFGWLVTIPHGLCTLFDDTDKPLPQTEVQSETTAHPLALLIQHNRNNIFVLATAFLTGVIVVPLTEEFIFRFLLQGYLVRRFGVFAIVFVSFLFAAMHGSSRGEYSDILIIGIIGVGIANIAAFVFGIFWLLVIRRIPIWDNFIRFNWTLRSAGRWILVTSITLPLLFVMTLLLNIKYPNSVIDPLPLFFFSLVLGLMYYRTQQLVTSVLLHAVLNAVSFALILLL
ncbi:hypothetical protein FACS1894170_04110 [Planctomycetales bacterium]|nr:hypothetical protein FACS1894170_04110 [Planctomycetales bacterium]